MSVRPSARVREGSTGISVLVLALVACTPRSPVPTSPMPPSTPDAGSTADAASPSAAASAYLVREPNGHFALVEGVTSESAAVRGAVVASFAPSARAKLGNASMVLARLERARQGEPVSLYAKLDGATAPKGEDARKDGLRAAGAAPQTIAGDVATVLVTPEKLGDLLGLPWVTGLETPGIVVPR